MGVSGCSKGVGEYWVCCRGIAERCQDVEESFQGVERYLKAMGRGGVMECVRS